MEYNCKISAYKDQATYDNLYDAECDLIQEKCFEDYDDAMGFLKRISQDNNVNYIEIITANGDSNRHVCFYRAGHPFADCEYDFNDIDWFIKDEKDNHTKRMENPEPFDLEMQYIDLFAGFAPEFIIEGKTANELLKSIPDGQKKIKNLLKLVCKSYVSVPEPFDLENTFNWGLPYFLAGITEASFHQEYWEWAWKGEFSCLSDPYNKACVNSNLDYGDASMDQINFIYFFLGVYFIGLRIYVS